MLAEPIKLQTTVPGVEAIRGEAIASRLEAIAIRGRPLLLYRLEAHHTVTDSWCPSHSQVTRPKAICGRDIPSSQATKWPCLDLGSRSSHPCVQLKQAGWRSKSLSLTDPTQHSHAHLFSCKQSPGTAPSRAQDSQTNWMFKARCRVEPLGQLRKIHHSESHVNHHQCGYRPHHHPSDEFPAPRGLKMHENNIVDNLWAVLSIFLSGVCLTCATCTRLTKHAICFALYCLDFRAL